VVIELSRRGASRDGRSYSAIHIYSDSAIRFFFVALRVSAGSIGWGRTIRPAAYAAGHEGTRGIKDMSYFGSHYGAAGVDADSA
jgi:hypothetical protein